MFVICDLARTPVNRYPLTDRKEYMVYDESPTCYLITDDLGKNLWYSKNLFFNLISDDESEGVTVEPINRLSNLIILYEERSSHYNKFGNYARSKELQIVIHDLRRLAKIIMDEKENLITVKVNETI